MQDPIEQEQAILNLRDAEARRNEALNDLNNIVNSTEEIWNRLELEEKKFITCNRRLGYSTLFLGAALFISSISFIIINVINNNAKLSNNYRKVLFVSLTSSIATISVGLYLLYKAKNDRDEMISDRSFLDRQTSTIRNMITRTQPQQANGPSVDVTDEERPLLENKRQNKNINQQENNTNWRGLISNRLSSCCVVQ